MQQQLGLVCLTSPTCATRISYRTLRKASVTPHALTGVYRDNARTLRAAVVYCKTVLRTRLYRMPSALLPWLDSDDPTIAEAAETAFAQALPHLRGVLVGLDDMRVTSHPDQFCVLSSDRPDVVASGVRMLIAEARVMDALGLPRSPWAGINIHGGKAGRLPQLRAAVDALPDAVRARLTLENDERAYTVPDLCTVGVPVVFDAHHQTVRGCWAPDDARLHEQAAAARRTWRDEASALAHLSNGIEGPHDRRHSDLISYVHPSLSGFGWVDVEAKGKECAILALQGRA